MAAGEFGLGAHIAGGLKDFWGLCAESGLYGRERESGMFAGGLMVLCVFKSAYRLSENHWSWSEVI